MHTAFVFLHKNKTSMNISKIPSWLKISVYLIILLILGYFGDLFTFLLGVFIITLVFANGYDREESEHH
jgi:hypothetical protein